ncbi:MAG TPA: hypothetical protein VN815_18385 [Steroidobacteraceae bacterium]|nr:hypothetical protein [Steroidobacteraceae bacterium]
MAGKLIRPPTLVETELSPAQRECIKLLKDALESAEKGDIWSCILVACGPNDFGTAMAGSDAPRLNLGLDAAKASILDRVTGKRSVIHR